MQSHNPLAPWSPSDNDAFDRRKAAHLLRRAGFGASPTRIDEAVRDGLEATVESFFDEAVAAEEDRASASAFAAVAGTFADFSNSDQCRAWWAHRLLRTAVPLREKLALFWHGHFATSVEKVEDVHLMVAQVDMLRRLGWGNFRDLVLAVARDPAMLVYLDGESNTKAHPNENFGRELMELFTCGIGPYTEDDIRSAARAFTGWNRDGGNFAFRAEEHDAGRKKFLGKAGRFDGGDVIDILIQHPSTARNIAAKLLRFFACPEPEPEVVAGAAALFERTRLDVKWFLRELFQSRYFFSAACYRGRISSPAEFIIGTIRALGAVWSGPEIVARLAPMGQVLLTPPNVKGWDGERRWINSSTWAARIECARAIAALESGSPHAANLDLAAIVPDSLKEPAEVVDRLADVLLQGDLGPEARAELAGFLVAAEDGLGAKAFREDDDSRRKKTRGAIALMLALPEYHAC